MLIHRCLFFHMAKIFFKENEKMENITTNTGAMVFDDWTFSSKNMNKFCDMATALTNAGQWITGITSSGINVDAIGGPMDVGEVEKKCGCSYNSAFDTCEGTRLILNTGAFSYCIRDTAMISLFDTAKIRGSALGRLDPESLSEVLNHCLKVANGSSLILNRADKVSAVMSDNAGGYRVMPQNELIEIALDKMTKRFGSIDFIKGDMEHGLTTFIVELPDAKAKINESYNYIVGENGRTVEIMPAVRFVTSDTGRSAATLKPLYRNVFLSGYTPIHDGLRVNHIRSKSNELDGVDKFAIVADSLYAKFDEAQETITKMANTFFNYPLNAYIAISKKLGIAKKYAKEGYEDLEHYCEGNPCTVHDVYLSLTHCLNAAETAGEKYGYLLKMEDLIARVLSMNWKDYDLPGVISWDIKVAA